MGKRDLVFHTKKRKKRYGIVRVLVREKGGWKRRSRQVDILCTGGVSYALNISLLISVCTYVRPLQGPLEGVGPENRDSFGPWMSMSEGEGVERYKVNTLCTAGGGGGGERCEIHTLFWALKWQWPKTHVRKITNVTIFYGLFNFDVGRSITRPIGRGEPRKSRLHWA